VEPIEQGDAVALDEPAPSSDTNAAAVPVEAGPPAESGADPAAKDDGLATDLGGKTVPINGVPDDKDETASAAVAPRTAAN